MASRDPEIAKNSLANALIEAQTAADEGTPDDRRLADRVIARDRRRVRILAALTLLSFALALAGVATHFYVYFVYIHPVAAGHWRDEGRILHKEAAQAEPAVPLDRLAIQGVSRLYIIQLVNLWTIGASLVALTVAALFTILLVLASRRATLRQVQVSLGEIAEQLKRLSAAGKPGA